MINKLMVVFTGKDYLRWKTSLFNMEPAFIYFNELEFEKLELKKKLFSTKKDYFNTKIICYLKLESDITS